MTYTKDLMNRIKQVQFDAFSDAGYTLLAAENWPYQQNDYPYFISRIGPSQYTERSSDIEYITRQVIMQLIVGHWTEGYDGEIEDLAYDYRDAFEDGFNARPQLTSTAFPAAPNWLLEGAYLQSDPGLIILQIGGTGSGKIAFEFTAIMEIIRQRKG